MDTLRLTPVDIYGATTTPIVFQFEEVIEINYEEQTNPVTFISAQGRSKSFQKPKGRAIRFAIVVRQPATIKKIDDLNLRIQEGYAFNCNILQGLFNYDVANDAAVFGASRGVISGGWVQSWGAWQTAIGSGLQLGSELAIEIIEGSKESEPQAGDYIGAPPLPGGN